MGCLPSKSKAQPDAQRAELTENIDTLSRPSTSRSTMTADSMDPPSPRGTEPAISDSWSIKIEDPVDDPEPAPPELARALTAQSNVKDWLAQDQERHKREVRAALWSSGSISPPKLSLEETTPESSVPTDAAGQSPPVSAGFCESTAPIKNWLEEDQAKHKLQVRATLWSAYSSSDSLHDVVAKGLQVIHEDDSAPVQPTAAPKAKSKRRRMTVKTVKSGKSKKGKKSPAQKRKKKNVKRKSKRRSKRTKSKTMLTGS